MVSATLTITISQLPKINTVHWFIWAGRKREGYAHIGYPRAVPWYLPPRTGAVFDKPREPVLDVDHMVADKIEWGVHKLKTESPKQAYYLEIEYGAYPNATADVKERCKQHNVPRGTCKKGAWRARKKVESWL